METEREGEGIEGDGKGSDEQIERRGREGERGEEESVRAADVESSRGGEWHREKTERTRVGDGRGGEGNVEGGRGEEGERGGYVYNISVMHKLSDAETMLWNLLTYAAI